MVSYRICMHIQHVHVHNHVHLTGEYIVFSDIVVQWDPSNSKIDLNIIIL